MVAYCVICKTDKWPGDSRSFHSFPKDEALLAKWLDITGLPREKIRSYTKICSNHFNCNDFSFSLNSKLKRLKNLAVPKYLTATPPHVRINATPHLTITVPNSDFFDILAKSDLAIHSENYNKTSVCSENSTSLLTENQNKVDSDICETPKKKTANRKLGGLSKEDFSCENAWTRYRKIHLDLRNQLRNARRLSKQRRGTKKKLLKSLHSLKRQNFPETAKYLENLPITLRQLIFRMKRTKKYKKSYTSEIKSFAIRLKSYSPEAYQFVRSQFFESLPSISTLNRWKTGEPGESSDTTSTY